MEREHSRSTRFLRVIAAVALLGAPTAAAAPPTDPPAIVIPTFTRILCPMDVWVGVRSQHPGWVNMQSRVHTGLASVRGVDGHLICTYRHLDVEGGRLRMPPPSTHPRCTVDQTTTGFICRVP